MTSTDSIRPKSEELSGEKRKLPINPLIRFILDPNPGEKPCPEHGC
ncbi:hypothetical protein LOY55_20365 [Pseudomonas sp. B21-040]|nr:MULTISPECIES: hypothetical protein [Pseudomonas]UVL38594.1 hypothetical protein LOY55_20365 [Pseudomonas sp. B21-040]